MPIVNGQKVIEVHAQALRHFRHTTGMKKVALGLSGGVDSAVVAGLLVHAYGPENVILVHSRVHTSADQTLRARKLAAGLGCKLVDVNLTAIYTLLMEDALRASAHGQLEIPPEVYTDPRYMGGLRSCIRAPLLDFLSKVLSGYSAWIAGTGNECEDRWTFYFQLRGDGAIDRSVISMHSKTEVFQLAWHLGELFPEVRSVFRELITVKPSADLWGADAGQEDEKELEAELGVPLTYGRVNPEDGSVIAAGTIERVNRFLDTQLPDGANAGQTLFYPALFTEELKELVVEAINSPYFKGMSADMVEKLLGTARLRYLKMSFKENPKQAPFVTRSSFGSALSSDLPPYTE